MKALRAALQEVEPSLRKQTIFQGLAARRRKEQHPCPPRPISILPRWPRGFSNMDMLGARPAFALSFSGGHLIPSIANVTFPTCSFREYRERLR